MPSQTLILILKTLYFFLPAALANMAPVLFKNINFFNKPINEKLFGSHKTYRGFFFGIILAIVISFIQFIISPYTNISIINYNLTNTLLIGFLLGFGAIFGDLVKSFFKRRIGIKPGRSFIPLDQIDWILGAIIFTLLIVKYSLTQIISLFVIYGLLHPLTNLIGYILKIKKNKF